MKRYLRAAILLSAVAVMIVAMGIVHAQGPGNDPGTLSNPIGCGSFGCVVTDIIGFLFDVSLGICPLMVLWGAFQMMTSAGNPEKFGSGQKTILYAAIGFVVLLLANDIVPIIQSIFK